MFRGERQLGFHKELVDVGEWVGVLEGIRVFAGNYFVGGRGAAVIVAREGHEDLKKMLVRPYLDLKERSLSEMKLCEFWYGLSNLPELLTISDNGSVDTGGSPIEHVFGIIADGRIVDPVAGQFVDGNVLDVEGKGMRVRWLEDNLGAEKVMRFEESDDLAIVVATPELIEETLGWKYTAENL